MTYTTTKACLTTKTSSMIHNFIMYALDKVHQSVAHVFQAVWKPAPTLQLSSMLPHIQLELSDDNNHKSAALPHLKLEGTYDMCASSTFGY
jgi:hypothetical protein